MSAIYALVVLLNALLAFASSAPPKPLVRIAHPTTHALEILPRHNTLKKRDSSLPFLDSPTLYHSDSFRLTLSAFNETYYLHLRPNDDLIHPAARINYYRNGVLDRTVPLLRESVRAYMGEVVSADRSQQRMREDAAGVFPRPELGWARIMVHSQGDAERGIPPVFEGAFTVRGVTHTIQSRDNYLRKRQALDPDVEDAYSSDSQLVIWRDSDVVQDQDEADGRQLCSHADPWAGPFSHLPWDDTWSANKSSISRRQNDVAGGGSGDNFESTIGQTAGCSATQRVVFMGVAADCSYVTTHGSTQNATTQIINNWNTASSVYKNTFNISLGIVELNVQEPECPSQAPSDAPWNIPCDNSGTTLNDRLSLFSRWRGQKGNDGAGLWHLMSGCPTGSEIGVAWLGTLCQQTTSGSSGSFVSGTAVSTTGRTEWEIVSHEIGHNFGAIHDCQSDCSSSGTVCCPLSTSSCDADDQYIMSPVTSSSQKTFSPCSIGNVCSVMQATSSNAINTTCLADPSSVNRTITLNMCGNGIVEEGEDCDPGQNSTSACCDAATCRFANNAQCDFASSPCCTNSCTFAPSGQVCRPATDASCDIAETCSGTSANCPQDQFQPNGQSCGSVGGDNLACANGVCTSLNQQCRIVGASLNLTTACRTQDDSCKVSCQDPNSPLQCIQLQSQVVDGSPCGYGGTCESGNCRSGSALDTAKAWYVQNLQISIPITVVAAILALLLIWALVLCCKRHCMKKPASMEPALSGQRGARLSSWLGPPVGQRPLPPVIPFASRPVPTQPTAGSGAGAAGHARGTSAPAVNEMRNAPPSSFQNVMTGVGTAQRNRSWDSANGQSMPPMPPPRAGSAASSRRLSSNSGGRGNGNGNGRPGSAGNSTTTRAREPVFPGVTAQIRPPPASLIPSHWVDPTAWNGPMR